MGRSGACKSCRVVKKDYIFMNPIYLLEWVSSDDKRRTNNFFFFSFFFDIMKFFFHFVKSNGFFFQHSICHLHSLLLCTQSWSTRCYLSIPTDLHSLSPTSAILSLNDSERKKKKIFHKKGIFFSFWTFFFFIQVPYLVNSSYNS